MKLQTRIFVALVAGTAAGLAATVSGAERLSTLLIALEPIGTAFIRLVTMVVIPLVIASLFVGISSLGDVRRLGRVGGKTLGYFVGTTFLAAVTGVVVATVAGTAGAFASAAPSLTPFSGGTSGATPLPGLVESLVNLIPQNPFAAAAQGDLLSLILAVAIFSAAATVTRGRGHDAVLAFLTGVNDIAMVVVRWLMALAPAAVFFLIAAAVARSGVRMLAALVIFAVVAVAAMAVHLVATLFTALRFGARLDLVPFVRKTSDAVMLAFSTASSTAALPISMADATEHLGVSNDIASFVLPSGATVNKNGSAVYKAVTAIFLAHVYGLALGPVQLITVVLVATAAAFAGAGVPGSSLVTTLIVLNAIGLGPNAAAGIALVTAIDRPLDMCRSAINTFGNLVGTAWLARSEGEALAGK